MKLSTHAVAFALALACIAGWLMRHDGSFLLIIPVGLLILAVALKLFGKKKQPDVLTRRWARAMFKAGLMSMEELNEFYATHPEVESFE